MGFGGGGGGALPAHVHNSVPLQGGPLDFANDTIASLSQGSVTFSDGAALQELVKPAVPAGEVLTYPALATSPSWQAAGAGVSVDIDSASLTSPFTTGSTSPTDVTGLVITIANIAGGQVMINANPLCQTDAVGALNTQLLDDTVYIAGTARRAEGFSNQQFWNNVMTHVMPADGSVIQVQVWSGGVLTRVQGATGANNATSNIVSLGVG